MRKLLNFCMLVSGTAVTLRVGIIIVLAWPSLTLHAAEVEAHSGALMNFHRIDETLVTGGHFIDGGIQTMQDVGVKIVVDLRDKPPQGQKDRLAEVGIRWISVPVVWTDPRAEDFEKFKAAMLENAGAHVLVQCQANYRASAMTYLYRVTAEGVAEVDARRDLDAVWTPNDRWQSFIDSILSETRE